MPKAPHAAAPAKVSLNALVLVMRSSLPGGAQDRSDVAVVACIAPKGDTCTDRRMGRSRLSLPSRPGHVAPAATERSTRPKAPLVCRYTRKRHGGPRWWHYGCCVLPAARTRDLTTCATGETATGGQ